VSRVWRGVPLWLKLLGSLLGLGALALALNGLVGARLVRSYLVDRLDAQLQVAVRPIDDGLADTAPADLPSPFYVSLVSPSGRVVDERWAPPSPDEAAPALPSLTLEDVRELGRRPFTVAGAGGEPDWRVVVEPVSDRAGSLVVARSLDDVDATVARLGRVSLVGGIALLGALAAAAYLVVRRSLRPLPGIEAAALALAEGDWGQRAPEADPHTELGRIGRAFNTMADQVQSAALGRERAEGVARQTDRRLRQFVADASRELRAPLMSLRSFTEAGRHSARVDPDTIDDVLRHVERESLRMGQLVDDMLLLTRLDQRHPLETAPVDLVLAARDAADAARVVALDRPIVFVGPEAPLVVQGDEIRLRHVVTNLVENALTHTPGGTKVEVAVGRTRRDDQGWAELEVRDEGPGLTTDQAERVFDRFYRTDQARHRPGGGAGLGLAIVDAIVTAHGGIAEVDVSSGEGTTFRVLLPVADEVEPPDRLPVPLAAPAPVSRRGG